MILLVNILTLIPVLIAFFLPPQGYSETQLINYLVFSNIYNTILLAIVAKRPLSKWWFFKFYIFHLVTYILIDLLFFNTYSPDISMVNIILNIAIFNIIFIAFNGLPLLYKYSISKKLVD